VCELVLLKADYREIAAEHSCSEGSPRTTNGPFPRSDLACSWITGAPSSSGGKNRSAVLTNELSPMNRQNRIQGIHYLK
jgi:hypothetical protein